MASETWRWQEGTNDSDSFLGVAVMESDGCSILAGFTTGSWDGTETGGSGSDFAAVKLGVDGDVMWRWQDGMGNSTDVIEAAMVTDDGCVVLVGHTTGDWSGNTSTVLDYSDFAAVKLDPDGNELWKWQDGSDEEDKFYSAAIGNDGSVVMAGYTKGSWNATNVGGDGSRDFAVAKIDVGGHLLWRWQDGTLGDDVFPGAAVGDDGSAVLAGYADTGTWYGSAAGDADFAAVKLSADGDEVWRWQEGTTEGDWFHVASMGTDGSVYLGGRTTGCYNNTNNGTMDFAAVKLDSDGKVLWRWQDGTIDGDDWVRGAAVAYDGSVILAGLTSGEWNGSVVGTSDFAVVRLDANGNELWRWQDGTTGAENIVEAGAMRPDGIVVLAGRTGGDWAEDFEGGDYDFAAVALETGVPPTPTPPTPTPTPTPVAPTNSSDPSSSQGWMVGGLVAAAVGAVIVAGVCLRRRCTRPKSSSTPMSTFRQASISATAGIAGDSAPPASGSHVSGLLRLGSSAKGDGQMGICVVNTDGGDTGRTDAQRDQQVVSFPDTIYVDDLQPVSSAPPLAAANPRSAVILSDGKGNTTLTEAVVDDHAKEMPLAITTSTADASTTDISALPPRDGFWQWNNDEHSELVHGVKNGDREANPAVAVLNWPAVDAQETDDVEGENKPREKLPASEWSNPVGIARAVAEAAEVLAHNTMVPGVSEAASLVCLVVKLAADHRSNAAAVDSRIRWCKSILAMLRRAGDVLGQNGDGNGDAEGVLLENVRDSINDLVQLMSTYSNKNKLSKVVTSSLCRRRQEEAEAAINTALSHLQLGLQVQIGQDVRDVKQGLQQKEPDYKGSAAQELDKLRTMAKRDRRQRRLDQIEIPANQLTVMNEVLGKGGFATVYLADYNGRNTAAKVQKIDDDQAGMDDDGMHEDERMVQIAARKNAQHRAFMRELEAMIRLRSPHTVHVYGAITSRSGYFILVMELLPGGDLRSLLKKAREPLAEDRARRIIGDIGAGMAFLHSKSTVHGDLKSANVLFDGAGRAKIADFGTSRWAQHTMSTGLATYTAKPDQQARMSFPWAAPEVLSSGASSYSSDIYSFGMVVWEILSRKVPWSSARNIADIHRLVALKGDRPEIPVGAPVDLARLCMACWVSEPERRPTFEQVLADLKTPDGYSA